MRIPACLIATLLAFAASAQVHVDVPLRLIGADRGVDGLATPTSSSSLVTVEGAMRNTYAWANASVAVTAITLYTQPPMAAYRNGSLLRFLAPSDLNGTLTIAVDGLAAEPLLRPDGLPPVVGQLVQGAVCEVMHVDGRFVLMNAAERGCPPGTVQVNERYCIETSSFPNQIIYAAADRCAQRGGRLCTWDEYHAACALQGAQLTGMFNEWEWIDDTSNHTHTAGQAGRTSCQSQRGASVLETTIGDTSCCFHPR